jgi:hypothetical protein
MFFTERADSQNRNLFFDKLLEKNLAMGNIDYNLRNMGGK